LENGKAWFWQNEHLVTNKENQIQTEFSRN
jgi:hypothetical protein